MKSSNISCFYSRVALNINALRSSGWSNEYMSKIIIGIHGLGNKPPKKFLERWWKKSIREGLKRIDCDRVFFNFKLIYWANFLHPNPLNPAINDMDNPLYLKEPYLPAIGLSDEKPSKMLQKILDVIEKELDQVLLNDDLTVNYSMISDLIIHHFFKDLDAYYQTDCKNKKVEKCKAKEIILEHVAHELIKHRRKDIMLIGHSMGSIIAYDILTTLAQELEIDNLVTIGSPLGIPVVMSRIAAEIHPKPPKGEKLTTPPNIIHNWFNISDLSDKIAFNYNLRDDFAANDYEINGEKNPHKSFGYLRTPDFARIVVDFLTHGRSALWNSWESRTQRVFGRFF